MIKQCNPNANKQTDNAMFACANYHSQQQKRNSKGYVICSPYIISMLVSTIAN